MNFTRKYSKRALERQRNGIAPFGKITKDSPCVATVETGKIYFKLPNGEWEGDAIDNNKNLGKFEKLEKTLCTKDNEENVPVKKNRWGTNADTIIIPPSNESSSIISEEMRLKIEKTIGVTLHVSNLSERTTECDLRWLFGRFGLLQKIYLPRQRHNTVLDENGVETHPVRGFAFVTFHHLQDAVHAQKHLDDYGWDHVLLHVDWVRKACPSYEIK
jgi:RNA recognition motif-containing protein